MHTSHLTSRGIHWSEQGPHRGAPAVVLLHGLGGDARFWLAEQTLLARDFRTLAIDLRGSGQSIGSDGPFTVDALAADVLEVLDAAGIDAAHVVGFSMGGVVAQALAVAASDRVISLVLAATFAKVNAQARLFLQAVGTLYRNGTAAERIYALIVPWLYSIPFLSSACAASHIAYVEDSTDRQTPEDWLCLLDALLNYDGSARLGDIRAPTLIIGGDQDCLAPPSDAQALADGIHGASLRMLPGGHLMNLESPAAFVDHIARFLSMAAC